MKERVTSEVFWSTDPNVKTGGTKLPPTTENVNFFLKHDKEDLVSSLLMSIFALAGLAGNAVVLWLLGFRMKRNSFSVYILNLAGADFLFLCCQIVHSLQRLIYFSDHSVFLYYSPFYITVFNFAYITGVNFLSAISTERCLSVLWPIWYRCHRPRHMSAVMCALLWALSLLLSTLEGKYCNFLSRDTNINWCRYIYCITTGWMILLFVLILGSNLALLTRLLCGSQQMQLTRLYVTIMLTVLVFLLCSLPFGICRLLLYRIGIFSYLYPVFGLYLVSHVLPCVNSCANPVIYFFVGSFRQRLRRRRTLKLALQRALQDFPEEDAHGGGLPQETQEMSERGLGQ